jgi:hypothetical protein
MTIYRLEVVQRKGGGVDMAKGIEIDPECVGALPFVEELMGRQLAITGGLREVRLAVNGANELYWEASDVHSGLCRFVSDFCLLYEAIKKVYCRGGRWQWEHGLWLKTFEGRDDSGMLCCVWCVRPCEAQAEECRRQKREKGAWPCVDDAPFLTLNHNIVGCLARASCSDEPKSEAKGICPVCGSEGDDLVFAFYCANPDCANYRQ